MGRSFRSFATRAKDRAVEYTSERGAKEQGRNGRFWRDEKLSAKGVDPVGEAHLHNIEAERILLALTREAEERYAAERAAAAAAAEKAAASVAGVVRTADGKEGAGDTADATVAEDEDGNGDTDDVLVVNNAASDSATAEEDENEGNTGEILVAVDAASDSAPAKEDEGVDDAPGVASAKDAVVSSEAGGDKLDDGATGSTGGVTVAVDPSSDSAPAEEDEGVDDTPGAASATGAVIASPAGGDKVDGTTAKTAAVAVAVDAASAPTTTS